MVVDAHAGQPAGIITEADVAHAIADGKDINDVWGDAVTTTRPAVTTTTSIRDTSTIMTARHFRHLPVAGGTGLLGVVDITDVCRALVGAEDEWPEPAADPDGQHGQTGALTTAILLQPGRRLFRAGDVERPEAALPAC